MDNALHMLILDIFQLHMYWFDPLKPNTLILSYTKYIIHTHIYALYIVLVALLPNYVFVIANEEV